MAGYVTSCVGRGRIKNAGGRGRLWECGCCIVRVISVEGHEYLCVCLCSHFACYFMFNVAILFRMLDYGIHVSFYDSNFPILTISNSFVV